MHWILRKATWHQTLDENGKLQGTLGRLAPIPQGKKSGACKKNTINITVLLKDGYMAFHTILIWTTVGAPAIQTRLLQLTAKYLALFGGG